MINGYALIDSFDAAREQFDLSQVNDWLYQLQNLSLSKVERSKFDLVNMDYPLMDVQAVNTTGKKLRA